MPPAALKTNAVDQKMQDCILKLFLDAMLPNNQIVVDPGVQWADLVDRQHTRLLVILHWEKCYCVLHNGSGLLCFFDSYETYKANGRACAQTTVPICKGTQIAKCGPLQLSITFEKHDHTETLRFATEAQCNACLKALLQVRRER